MHDTAPITGACHYFRSCERYKDQCGACYQLNSNQNKDLSHISWLEKKEAYNLINTKQLYFASPSNWLKQKSQESSLTKKFHVEHIPNGVDPYIFKPVNKKKIKELLNIPLNKKIILFIQKGESFLVECLKKNKNLLSEIVFITIGNPAKQLNQIAKTIHFGTIWNEELKSLIFGMCDYFILPSDIDNLPNTILESFASGTPVVASNVGGIPELVENEKTGYLFQWGDNESCLRAIKKMNSLNNDNVKEMGNRCIESVRNHYTMELQAKKYTELYKKVLSI
jgi:glycosyltransferase involved in cell wall biosynthesis